MTQSIEFQKTADGMRAASIGHLVMAIAVTENGFRNLIYAGSREVEDLQRSDFMNDGPADQAEKDCIARITSEAEDQVQKGLLGRRQLTDEELKQLPNTDWGKADGATYYAPGIVSVFTPSHGGYIITDEVRATLPKEARIKSRSRIGHVPGQTVTVSNFSFYEEDCAWALLALGKPSIFTDREREYAERVLINDFPDEWEAVRGEIIPAGESRTREYQRKRAEAAGKLLTISAINDKNNPGKVRVGACIDGRSNNGSLGKIREFLVDAARYETADMQIGYIVDEALDIEIDANGQPLSVAKAA